MKEETRMNCPKCGAPKTEGAKYCVCGYRWEAPMPNLDELPDVLKDLFGDLKK